MSPSSWKKNPYLPFFGFLYTPSSILLFPLYTINQPIVTTSMLQFIGNEKNQRWGIFLHREFFPMIGRIKTRKCHVEFLGGNVFRGVDDHLEKKKNDHEECIMSHMSMTDVAYSVMQSHMNTRHV